jgi:hypothetical protein
MNEVQTRPRSVTGYKHELGFVKTLFQLKTIVQRPKRWRNSDELIKQQSGRGLFQEKHSSGKNEKNTIRTTGI